MLKIIIADDEPITLEALKAILSRTGVETQVVGEAANGLETLELLLKRDADLVITDVKMPVMDGIGLMRAIKSRGIQVKVVVLSAYRDFEYAREAVNNGASGYLLKPLRKEQLAGLLDEISAQLKRERPRDDSSGALPPGEAMERLLAGTPDALPREYRAVLEGAYRVAIAEPGQRERRPPAGWAQTVSQRMRMHTPAFAATRAGRLVLCFGESAKTRLIIEAFRELTENLSESRTLLGVSAVRKGAGDFGGGYAQAEQALSACFYQAAGGICMLEGDAVYRHIGDTGLCTEEEVIRHVLQERRDAAMEALRSFHEAMEEEHGIYPMELVLFYTNLLHSLKKELRRKYGGNFGTDMFDTYAARLSAARCLEELSGSMLEILDEIFSMCRSSQENDTATKVKWVEAYCGAHYKEEITLDMLAEGVGVTKNYLCHLFKEAAGVSLWDYLTDLRIEKAKELLRLPDTKANRIGLSVGYQNAGHFGRVFKARVGMTPMEYKKRSI